MKVGSSFNRKGTKLKGKIFFSFKVPTKQFLIWDCVKYHPISNERMHYLVFIRSFSLSRNKKNKLETVQ